MLEFTSPSQTCDELTSYTGGSVSQTLSRVCDSHHPSGLYRNGTSVRQSLQESIPAVVAGQERQRERGRSREREAERGRQAGWRDKLSCPGRVHGGDQAGTYPCSGRCWAGVGGWERNPGELVTLSRPVRWLVPSSRGMGGGGAREELG